MKRFFKYSFVGVSTFLLDLFLLFLFTDFFDIHYLVSVAIAFSISVTVQYFISRHYVFKGTLRSVHEGYIIFLLIMGGGLALITFLMYVLVDVFLWHYLAARVITASFTGIINYLMNLYVNFRVSGREG